MRTHRFDYELHELHRRCADWVTYPDSSDSEGARFLRAVQAAVGEAVAWHNEDPTSELEELVREAVAGVIPVYTYPRLRTWIDLGAFYADDPYWLRAMGDALAEGRADHMAEIGLSEAVWPLAEWLAEGYEDEEDEA